MRILFISHYFNPEPVLSGMPFVRQLVEFGHEVEVLTGFPNYPGGKVYPGYKVKLFQREMLEGIRVNRTYLYPSHDRSSAKRFMTYMSFGLSGAILGPWMIKKADVAFVYSPPATVWMPAASVRLFRGIPFVYNIQDMWPDALASSTMVKNGLALRLADKCCRFIYRNANRVVAQSNGFKDLLVQRGIPENQIDVIYNWCDDKEIRPIEYNEQMAKDLGLYGRFNIMFAGGMGKGQALSAVIEAANLVKDKFPEVQFVFLGSGIEKDMLVEKVKEYSLNNVKFLERCLPSEVGKYLTLADVLLVHLKDNLIHEITVPSKIQAYMNVGKPILIGAIGDAASLVERAGAGIKCQPEDPQKIADAVERFYKMPREELVSMGKKGQQYYRNELSLEVGVRRYEKVFEQVIAKKRS